uniref:Uncharacterized protein n=1 Tax=Manihot esculenta TaxID=3983 RepID=A0A2C9UFX4_MANES
MHMHVRVCVHNCIHKMLPISTLAKPQLQERCTQISSFTLK